MISDCSPQVLHGVDAAAIESVAGRYCVALDRFAGGCMFQLVMSISSSLETQLSSDFIFLNGTLCGFCSDFDGLGTCVFVLATGIVYGSGGDDGGSCFANMPVGGGGTVAMA